MGIFVNLEDRFIAIAYPAVLIRDGMKPQGKMPNEIAYRYLEEPFRTVEIDLR